MRSSFGKNIITTIFGSSHGEAIGVVIDGMPMGEEIDLDELGEFLQRRAPGSSEYTTKRREEDKPIFLTGLGDNVINSNTICAIIKNTDTRSKDYDLFKDIPRPSHADVVARAKFDGKLDMRGSGPFSARLTAPLCIAGGIAIQILEKKGIRIGSHISQIGPYADDPLDFVNPDMDLLKSVAKKRVPVINQEKEREIENLLEQVIAEEDSLGAEIQCVATGVPMGLGDLNYDSFESRLAALVFGVPATRGISFGTGTKASTMRGSQHNDPLVYVDREIRTKTNNAGGIVGGITNAMPIVFRVTMKPTSSISQSQESISFTTGESVELNLKGRHDPCVGLRALPIIESLLALVILDSMVKI